MKPKNIATLVKFSPKNMNIFFKVESCLFSLIIGVTIGSVSAVSAQQIIESSGQVLLKRGSSDYRLTGAGQELEPGDSLFPQRGSVAKVLCDASNSWSIWRVPVGIPSSVNSGCPKRSGNLRGRTRYRPGGSNPQIPYILHPRMTYLLQDRPTLRWNAVPGATSYTVRLLGPGGLEWEQEVSSTEIVYSGGPLKRGVKYLLTVEADNGSCSLEDNGGDLGFEILREYKVPKIETEVAKISGLKDRTEEETTLTLAELYRRENLNTDAIATLEAMIEQGSQTALVFRRLGDLYAATGLNLLAEKNYQRASELFASTSDQYALTATKDSLAKVASENQQQNSESKQVNSCSALNADIKTPTE